MFRTVRNVTIDSEDRPIQIVCSLLSFYGQCYIQNKKRVKPKQQNWFILLRPSVSFRFSITTLVILGWNGWNHPNIHSVYAISCCFVVSKLVVLSHNVYLSLHFVVCRETTYHKIISSFITVVVTDNQMLSTLKDHYWPLYLPSVIACSCCEHTEYRPCIKCCTVVLFEMSYIYSLSIPKIT